MTQQPFVGTHGAIPAWRLPDRLRRAREHAELEQAELAQSLGVNRNTISTAERGKTQPRRSVLMAWALATGVDLHWLETGEAPSPGDGDGASVSLSQAKRARRDSNPQPSDPEPGRVVELRPAVAA